MLLWSFFAGFHDFSADISEKRGIKWELTLPLIPMHFVTIRRSQMLSTGPLQPFSSTPCAVRYQLFADLAVRRDEAGDAHQAGVGEQLGHFRNSPDVFFPVFGGEAQVLVQPVANVVSVQGVTRDRVGHEVLLQGKADGGLPGARQAWRTDESQCGCLIIISHQAPA